LRPGLAAEIIGVIANDTGWLVVPDIMQVVKCRVDIQAPGLKR
jgi:hypothetical protein